MRKFLAGDGWMVLQGPRAGVEEMWRFSLRLLLGRNSLVWRKLECCLKISSCLDPV